MTSQDLNNRSCDQTTYDSWAHHHTFVATWTSNRWSCCSYSCSVESLRRDSWKSSAPMNAIPLEWVGTSPIFFLTFCVFVFHSGLFTLLICLDWISLSVLHRFELLCPQLLCVDKTWLNLFVQIQTGLSGLNMFKPVWTGLNWFTQIEPVCLDQTHRTGLKWVNLVCPDLSNVCLNQIGLRHTVLNWIKLACPDCPNVTG